VQVVAIVVIGLNHRTAPLDVLERVTLSGEALTKALHDLRARAHLSEVVLLSTCNRTEVYASTERFHGAYADIRDFFCSLAGLAPEELHPHLVSQHDEEAATHLFEVAAGLRSAVLGESEILGQVRAAWTLAHREGTTRAALNLLFRRAVEAGKRARAETAIGRGTASVSHAAVEMAEERLGPLHGKKVVVVGAGDVGRGAAVALASRGLGDLVIANRGHERGATLAGGTGGRVISTAELGDELVTADVVVTCTGAELPILDHEGAASVVARRRARPLLILDIAIPRDVDGHVADLPGVTLLDLEDLRDWADRGRQARAAEADLVRAIVAEEVDRYLDDASAREVAPIIGAMHDRAEQLRSAELARFERRLAELSAEQREAVEALTRGVVAKLLRPPTVRLRQDAGTSRGERNASALRDLFDLP
jgi:glutamyl-tRNA reductase